MRAVLRVGRCPRGSCPMEVVPGVIVLRVVVLEPFLLLKECKRLAHDVIGYKPPLAALLVISRQFLLLIIFNLNGIFCIDSLNIDISIQNRICSMLLLS